MKQDLNFHEQRQFERTVKDGVDLPQEILKLYKLRMIISRAWIPMGIDRNEGADILLWAIGEDVAKLHLSHWPERIMENTGLVFNPKVDKVIDIMRKVAKVWQSKKVKPYYTGA